MGQTYVPHRDIATQTDFTFFNSKRTKLKEICATNINAQFAVRSFNENIQWMSWESKDINDMMSHMLANNVQTVGIWKNLDKMCQTCRVVHLTKSNLYVTMS